MQIFSYWSIIIPVNFCQRSFEDFGIPEEHIITIPEGEHHKSLESVAEIWQVLSDQGARRNAVLVNVGGGVITDLGGFALLASNGEYIV